MAKGDSLGRVANAVGNPSPAMGKSGFNMPQILGQIGGVMRGQSPSLKGGFNPGELGQEGSAVYPGAGFNMPAFGGIAGGLNRGFGRNNFGGTSGMSNNMGMEMQGMRRPVGGFARGMGAMY